MTQSGILCNILKSKLWYINTNYYMHIAINLIYAEAGII